MSFLQTVRTWVNLLEREKERETDRQKRGRERGEKCLFKQTILKKVYREVTQKFVVNKQKRELESFDSFVQLPAIGNRSSPSDAASNIRQTVYIRPMSRNEAIFVQCIFLCSFSCTLDKPEMSTFDRGNNYPYLHVTKYNSMFEPLVCLAVKKEETKRK